MGNHLASGINGLEALDIDHKDAMTHKGGPLVYKPQALTWVQEGKYGVGMNRACRALRLRVARQDMYKQLRINRAQQNCT